MAESLSLEETSPCLDCLISFDACFSWSIYTYVCVRLDSLWMWEERISCYRILRVLTNYSLSYYLNEFYILEIKFGEILFLVLFSNLVIVKINFGTVKITKKISLKWNNIIIEFVRYSLEHFKKKNAIIVTNKAISH